MCLRLLILILVLFVPIQAIGEQPNVISISIDDLNDWIGCLAGHPQTLTPNIDRLAQQGVLFTNAHCSSPACNPSRAAVFSGLRPKTTGIWSNDSPKLKSHRPDIELFPTTFSKAGYTTLGTGKLLHGNAKIFDDGFYTEQRWSPFGKREADYTKDELASKATNRPKHLVVRDGATFATLPLNEMRSDRAPDEKKGESFDWGPLDIADEEMGDTKITNWAIEQISSKSTKPLLMGVGYYRPHIPLYAPKKYFEPFRDPIQLPPVLENDLDDLPSIAREKWALAPITAGSHATVVAAKEWQNAVRAYLACVHYVDHEVGRLLDALEESDKKDNTIIVLWSDHGWHLGEKQHWGKWNGWERSTRVPLIVVPPKNSGEKYQVGQTCKRPVNLLDLFPTLVELCDLEPPHELDGRSLVPLLVDPKSQPDRASVTIFDKGNVSVRLQQSRYIRYADGSEEFYDHNVDSNEWHNRLSEGRSVGTKNEAALQRCREIASDVTSN